MFSGKTSNPIVIFSPTSPPASLDAKLGDDGSSERSEVIADERCLNPFEQLEHKTSINLVQKLVKKLKGRELKILIRRFGLDGKEPMTLSEIGEEFGVTRERIRQLQNEALGHLRGMMEELDSSGGTREAAA